MEQLIIFLLLVVASIVSSIIQNKKKREEEEVQARELAKSLERKGQHVPPKAPAPQPKSPWSGPIQDWQERLRRLLEEGAPQPRERPPAPPPLEPRQPPPKVAPVPAPPREGEGGDGWEHLRQSATASAHDRVAKLQSRVGERLRKVKAQTVPPRGATVTRRSDEERPNEFVRSLRGRPASLRHAFAASLIFSPPKSLEKSGSQDFF